MILVSGATGTVGRQVLHQLVERDAHLRALVHTLDDEAEALRTHGVELAHGDYDAPYTLRRALSGIESAYLVAPGNAQLAAREGHFLAAAEREGVRRLVKQSWIGARLSPISALGRQHLKSEEQIAWSLIDWTLLRPSVFMTELIRLAPEVRQTRRLRVPGSEGKVAFVDPRDVAAVGVAALTGRGHAGKSYEVTGPEAVSYAELTERLEWITGVPIDLVVIDEEILREELRARRVDPFHIETTMELHALARSGALARVTDTVLRVTGQPPRTLDTFLREHAHLFAGVDERPHPPAG